MDNTAALIDREEENLLATVHYILMSIKEEYKDKILPRYLVMYLNSEDAQSYFKGLKYEDRIVILKKVKESPMLADIFVSAQSYEENRLSENQFRVLMQLIEQIDFLPTLQKDQEEKSHKVGEAFLELINQVKQAQRWLVDGITPSSLRELMAGLNSSVDVSEIYDPVIGTGSLAIQVAVKNNIKSVYGQEIMPSTARLCKILLIAYGMIESVMNIKQGNTLLQPLHLEEGNLRKFKNIVAVPPFGAEVIDKDRIKNDPYGRYPEKVNMRSSEMLFIYHILESLDEGGMASVLTPNGILFRGGAEAKMREQLLRENCIDCIIQLPGKMLTHVPIPTTLIIFKKKRTRQDILFMDLTGEVDKISKLTTQLSEATIKKACDLYHNYQDSKISKIIPLDEILANESNLNVTRYVIQKEEQQIDLEKVNDTIAQLEKKLSDIQAKIKEKLY